jgi:catechol 2,3-dioxygenase-like lactoylglutathione lyase family enzyme
LPTAFHIEQLTEKHDRSILIDITVVDHITLPVRDYAVSRRFYEETLRPLGIVPLLDWPDGRKAWFGVEGEPSSLWLCESHAAGTLELALTAEASEAVEEFHAAAVKAGGYSDWLPGVRPEFNRQYFAARVRDPDGNSIEAVYRGAVAEAATPQSMAA